MNNSKLLLLMLFGMFISACNNGNSNNIVSTNEEIKLPEDICKVITKQTIIDYFYVDESDVDLVLKKEISRVKPEYSKCGYEWKKVNYEQLNEIYTDFLIQSVKKGKVDVKEFSELESPFNTVQVGSFRLENSLKEAKTIFTKQHRIPTEEDIRILRNKSEQEKKNQGIEPRTIGQTLSEGIALNIRFTTIEGVGDEAYYSHFDKSLDVRYGKLSFKVYIDTYLGHEEDLIAAKSIAQDIIDDLRV